MKCEHKITNGLHFHPDTPNGVAEALYRLRCSQSRCRIWYGDTQTGKVWDEENDVTGAVEASTGSCKVPLLIPNARSIGGTHLLDHCILKIVNINARQTIYKHPKFQEPYYTARPSSAEGYVVGVYREGRCVANFKTEKKARRWVDFMIGKRFNK